MPLNLAELDEKRRRIVDADGPTLVLGGPGAGKTTVALYAAERWVSSGKLKPGQRILFLSFARATVARVLEAAKEKLSPETLARVEVDTYHGFCWRLIKSHGYLVNRAVPKLLMPAEAAALFAGTGEEARREELDRLWNTEGRIDFNRFGPVVVDLLGSCRKLASIYSRKYPLIVLDEFQDTSSEQWDVVKCVVGESRALALADPDQRIYDFAGADPKRIGEFIEHFKADVVDLSTENHRSAGTDIVAFGTDLLTGANLSKTYADVKLVRYPQGKGRGSPEFTLKAQAISRINALRAGGRTDWSLAVLVPSNPLMVSVANYFGSSSDGLPTVFAQVHVDKEGPCLAADLIAGLLEGGSESEVFARLLACLRIHVRGRKGDRTSKSDLEFAQMILDFDGGTRLRKKDHLGPVEACQRIARARASLRLSGKPEEDWRLMIEILLVENDPRIVHITEDAKHIRLLRKGSALRNALNALWSSSGDYRGARESVQAALTQLHFAQHTEAPHGVHLMTLHKSKGKEYDEVILFEGPYARYIFAEDNGVSKARPVLRVGVTRARARATILTPQYKPCPIFFR